MLLPDEVIQVGGAHPHRQRRLGKEPLPLGAREKVVWTLRHEAHYSRTGVRGKKTRRIREKSGSVFLVFRCFEEHRRGMVFVETLIGL